MINETLHNNTSSFSEASVNLAGNVFTILGNLMQYVKPALVALAILIIGGWILRKVMKLLSAAIEKAKIDALIEKTGFTKELEELGIKITPSKIITGTIGLIAKFILWMAAINALQIDALTNLMQTIIQFILQDGIVALILLFVGITVAKVVKELIETSSSALSISEDAAKTFGKVSKVIVLVLTAMVVLSQLHIAENLINSLFNGIIATITIAAGIAFGLGGQEKAKEIINNICKK